MSQPTTRRFFLGVGGQNGAAAAHLQGSRIVKASLREQEGGSLAVVTISYDEKPGLQALAATTPDRPRCRMPSQPCADFIAFLQKRNATYAPHQKIRLILDNHSAHVSKETRSYLETEPQRLQFVFTPPHGWWLNRIGSQFSKMSRTMLRGIRVASKKELIDRIHQYLEEINSAPLVFRWKYKMEESIRFSGSSLQESFNGSMPNVTDRT